LLPQAGYYKALRRKCFRIMLHFVNFISIINRAAKQQQLSSIVKNTKLIRENLKKFMVLGYIRGFTIVDPFNIMVYLKHDALNTSSLKGAHCVSKPGKRIYMKYKNFDKVNTLVNSNSSGTVIISTSEGLCTHKEALTLKRGGEILCIIR
jgi:small subunit ribosomal protein S8